MRPRLDTSRLTSRLRGPIGLLLALAALSGQLAAVADALFVAHVTCLAHGERIHVSDGPHRPVAERWAGVRGATFEAEGHAHAQCLFDDDTAAVTAPEAPTLSAPRTVSTVSPFVDSQRRPLCHLPLYRLAPKNSPPA